MPFAVPRTPVGSPRARSHTLRAVLAALLGLAGVASPAGAGRTEPPLEEKVLANKYRHGDYGIYMGWHDPWDWQFDEHGSSAWPIGLRVRLRWLDWLRVEGDLSYYRRSEEPPFITDITRVPQFDGLVLGASVQTVLRRVGFWRPYVGTGPVVVSLGNDFLVFRPEVWEADHSNSAQVDLADWSKFDVGWQFSGGVDFFLGGRVSPFVEYRHEFGSLSLDDSDVRLGGLTLIGLQTTIEELHTVPADPNIDHGRPHSRTYDWSGPIVSVGLKVLF